MAGRSIWSLEDTRKYLDKFNSTFKTLKQANKLNPNILQVYLGLFRTHGTTVFESSCVCEGNGGVGDTDIVHYMEGSSSWTQTFAYTNDFLGFCPFQVLFCS